MLLGNGRGARRTKMTYLKVTLVKSPIHALKKQKDNIRGLGLKRVGQKVILENTPSVRGMVKKVISFLSVEQ